MMRVEIAEQTLRDAAREGMDAFLGAVASGIERAAGGPLSGATMARLGSAQTTLLGYLALRGEVMDGGFVQLIHNGWGPFFFRNPFDRAVREWGLGELCSIVRRAHKLYTLHHEAIERDCTDEEFMALYERFPDFDDVDDRFVEYEEEATGAVARYVDDHLQEFCTVVGGNDNDNAPAR